MKGIYAAQGDAAPRGATPWLIGMLFAASVLNFADRAVFSVLAQTIKTDLRLSDFELGLLQGLVFALLYGLAGLPLGRLAERVSRTSLIAAATVVWSAATAATGAAHSFFQLALARLVVGGGEAGFTPAAASLVADVAPRSRRASTMALVQLGSPVGAFSGAVLAGMIASAVDWRTAFFAFAVPGFIVAAVLHWMVREPVRGQNDDGGKPVGEVPPLRDFFRSVWSTPALVWVIAGGSIAGIGMTAISQFMAVFLARTYSLGVGQAATLFGVVSGISLTTGLLVGSFGTDRLSARDPRWPAWGAAIGLCLAPPLYWIAFAGFDLKLAVVLLLLAGSLLLVFYGPTSGMIQNLLSARMRATGIALYTLLYTLLGSGLGPVLVGAISDRMAARSYAGAFHVDCPKGLPLPGAPAEIVEACRAASALGLQLALCVAVSLLFVSALCFLRAARGLKPAASQTSA